MTDADAKLSLNLDAIAEALLDAIEDHEAATHGGMACTSGRAKALAHVARRLGFANEAQVLLVAHHWSRMEEKR